MPWVMYVNGLGIGAREKKIDVLFEASGFPFYYICKNIQKRITFPIIN